MNTICQAAFSEAKEVAALAIQMWTSHTVEELTEEFEALISRTDAAVFLLKIGECPAGFAQCQLRHDYVEGTETSPVGYLEGVFVAPSYRKQGYGSALVEACEAWARKQGCREFASDCELSNAQSFAFHLHSGFREAGRIICFAKKL